MQHLFRIACITIVLLAATAPAASTACAEDEELDNSEVASILLQTAKTVSGQHGKGDSPRFPSMQNLMLPKLLFIGLNHAGSTTIADHLNDHPNASFGTTKEHRFFLHPSNLSAYQDEFNVDSSTILTFDASPLYIFLGNTMGIHAPLGWIASDVVGREAVERISTMLGSDLKILFLAREPTEWITSMRSTGTRIGTMEGFGADFVSLSCYANSLETWLDVFDRKQFLFLDFDAVFANVSATMDQITAWLNLPAWDYTNSKEAIGRRRSTYVMPSAEKKSLQSLPSYHDCKNRLERLTGLSFAWR